MVSKVELLRLILAVAAHAGVRVGVGGGLAVCAWGYRRETADVDAFFHEGDRAAVLRSLHSLLPESFVLEKLDRSHYVVVPEGNSPDERIDLLFASGDPEKSAIEMSVTRKYRGVDTPVFPADMLVACKFLADRGEIKDILDVHELLERGACTVSEVQQRLRQMGLVEDADVRFPELISYLDHIPKRK